MTVLCSALAAMTLSAAPTINKTAGSTITDGTFVSAAGLTTTLIYTTAHTDSTHYTLSAT
jgi:hypothetical protein